jgi:hypothetical protein
MMALREAYETQDVRRMCKHAERHQESKKLVALIGRLNRQLAAQGIAHAAAGKPPASVLPNGGMTRQAGRVVVLDN